MGMIRRIASILIALVLLSTSLYAAGFQNTGVGFKAKGLGGAFRAVADDWSAAYYNPAGLAYINDNQLGASSGFIHFRHELTPDYYYSDAYANEYSVGVFDDRTLYNRHEIHSMPAVGAAARLPLFGESVLGLSAFQTFDNNLAWTVWESPLAYNDSIADKLDDNQLECDLDVVAFQVTLAKEVSEDQLSLGLGLQLLRADLVFKDLYFRENPMDAPLSDRPFDKIPEFTKNDGSGYGFGLNLGMMWKLNEQAQLAATIAIPFSIDISGTTEFTYVMPKGTTYLPYQPATPEYLFSNGGTARPIADFETTLDLPFTLGLGLAYDVNESLTLSLDAEYTAWSRFEGLVFTYSEFYNIPNIKEDTTGSYTISKSEVNDFLTKNLSNPVDWDNTLKLAVGANYAYNDVLTLLGGVSFDQSPMSSSDLVTPLFVDPGDKLGFSGGLLMNFDRWELGLSTAYFYTSDEQTVGTLIDVDSDGIDDNFSAVYGANTYETTLSVNYRF